MAPLLTALLVFVGFIFGYFFQTPVLLAITIGCVVIGIYMAINFREMTTLITMIFIGCAAIFNVVMWVTHYFVTSQSWLQTFFKTYIFR